jgi:hypothetical protein
MASRLVQCVADEAELIALVTGRQSHVLMFVSFWGKDTISSTRLQLGSDSFMLEDGQSVGTMLLDEG